MTIDGSAHIQVAFTLLEGAGFRDHIDPGACASFGAMSTARRRRAADTATDEAAEEVRATLSAFVRHVRGATGSVRTTQGDTLEVLAAHKGMSIVALARARGVRHQSMRLVVADLMSEGFAKSAPDPSDARAQLISITALGRRKLASGRRGRSDFIADRMSERLSPGEQRELLAGMVVLRKLL
ncbi:MarR family winged helix-turn-helix transcriptional regulator [Luteibacter sp. PPL552]